MSTIACIASMRPVGATFVDWSIHFLSGKTHYYQYFLKQSIPLVDDPITDNFNAHGHMKNHPNGFESVCNMFDQIPNLELYSFYPQIARAVDIAKKINIPSDEISSKWSLIQQQQKKDYAELFDFCADRDVKIVYIDSDPNSVLYHSVFRSTTKNWFTNELLPTTIDSKDHIAQVFFSEDIKVWQDAGLDNIWDRREHLALCVRPFDTEPGNTNLIDFSKSHLWISSQDLWFNGLSTIKKIMRYLELDIIEDRLASWITIYQRWQRHQAGILEFSFNCKHIVDSIVNNWFYEINLTFDQEVIIQHCLIYQHGLNLKTWQLEKFPSNTQQLHQLLEPNTHTVDTIY